MMAMANPYERYREQGVMMTNPVGLVIMLYDGCIKQLKLAKIAINENNYEKTNICLQKAQAIVMELVNSLDFHYEIAKDLMRIYDFILNQFIEINVQKNAVMIDGVIGLLSTLREAWNEVRKMNKCTLNAVEE